jgi:AcrR family transcriptional regulator
VTRRDQTKEENRSKLIAAARKVFAEKGFGAATVRDIVRETDLASGTFYNYFDDKEDAFRAIFDEFAVSARAGARAGRLQPGVGVEERLFSAYCSYFLLVTEDPQLFEIIRRNADAIAMLSAEDLFEEAIRELVEDMELWVREGQIPHGVAEWLPYVARSIAGGGFQVAAEMADRGESDADALARFCTRLLLDGLRGLG